MSTTLTSRRRGRAALVSAAVIGVGASLLLVPSAQAAPTLTKTFNRAFNDTCQIPPFGTQTLPAGVKGTVPTTVVHGATFSLTGGVITVTVPQSLGSAAYFAGARSGQVRFTTVNIKATNTTKAVTNAVPSTGITTAKIPVNPNGTTTFTAPPTGAVSVPFTAAAGAAGKSVTLSVGSVTAFLTLYNSSGGTLISNQSVSCAAPSPVLVLTKIPVS